MAELVDAAGPSQLIYTETLARETSSLLARKNIVYFGSVRKIRKVRRLSKFIPLSLAIATCSTQTMTKCLEFADYNLIV